MIRKSADYPEVVDISRVINEAEDTRSLEFLFNRPVTAGQFFMVWIPGVDEIPMSCSYSHNSKKRITFRRVGEATDALYQLKKGDNIRLRGPYGNGFSFTGEKILMIGGGTGIATLGLAVTQAVEQNKNVSVVIGAQTEKELFFEKSFEQMETEDVWVSTDDGTKGYHGFASSLAADVIKQRSYDLIITCGPELMMKKIVDVCQQQEIPVQASLERYIKCGIGICGQCCIGEGLRVCKDGPVFTGDTLASIDDFGCFKRDAAGRKIRFERSNEKR